jgi:hypothetical protein
MQLTSHFGAPLRRPLVLPLVAALGVSLGVAAPAADASDAALVRAVASSPIDQLLFDEPGDGAAWVRGATFKPNALRVIWAP